MNGGVSIWDKLTRIVQILLLLAAACIVFLWYLPVVQENERMRKQILDLQEKAAKEEKTARDLDAALKALQDPRTVERLAREKLSYAKPGEEVIHFDAPATNPVPARP